MYFIYEICEGIKKNVQRSELETINYFSPKNANHIIKQSVSHIVNNHHTFDFKLIVHVAMYRLCLNTMAKHFTIYYVK